MEVIFYAYSKKCVVRCKVIEVIEYKKDKYYLVIDFEGIKIRYFDNEIKNNVNLAYSISCHKSQGAGCDYVIIIVPKAHTFMLNSNLLYVAVTRTKKRCYMIGDPKVVRQAIKKKANFENEEESADSEKKQTKIISQTLGEILVSQKKYSEALGVFKTLKENQPQNKVLDRKISLLEKIILLDKK